MTTAPLGAASGEEQLQAAAVLLRSAIASVPRPVSSAVESLLAETAAQINSLVLAPKEEAEPETQSIDDLLKPKAESKVKKTSGLASLAREKKPFTEHRINTIEAARLAAGEVLEKILAQGRDRGKIDRLFRQLGNGMEDAQKQHRAFLRLDTERSGRELAAIEARDQLKRLTNSNYTDGSVHIARGYELAPIGETTIRIPIMWIGAFHDRANAAACSGWGFLGCNGHSPRLAAGAITPGPNTGTKWSAGSLRWSRSTS